MPLPALTITGTLQDLFGAPLQNGVVIFQLCNYGANVPRVAGTSIIAKTAPDMVETGVPGTFSKTLYGNDVIVPAGTFYTVQIQDDNGNIVQTGAFQFVGSGTIDLSSATPYDPATPIPPLPTPTVNGLLVLVPFSANPSFDASLVPGVIAFQMPLTGNVASSSLINGIPGSIVTFILIQDGTGGRTFSWPANVHNTVLVDPDPNSVTVQSFIVRADGALFPIGAGTYN